MWIPSPRRPLQILAFLLTLSGFGHRVSAQEELWPGFDQERSQRCTLSGADEALSLVVDPGRTAHIAALRPDEPLP